MKYVASFPGHSHLQPLQYANAEREGLEDLVISTSGRWRIGTLRVTPNGGSQSCCNSIQGQQAIALARQHQYCSLRMPGIGQHEI